MVLHEVLVGDVWLCGGQSNMEFGLGRARNGAEEIKAAEHPEMRLFLVKQRVAYSPTAVPQGTWKICSPQTVAERVGWIFGGRILFWTETAGEPACAHRPDPGLLGRDPGRKAG